MVVAWLRNDVSPRMSIGAQAARRNASCSQLSSCDWDLYLSTDNSRQEPSREWTLDTLGFDIEWKKALSSIICILTYQPEREKRAQRRKETNLFNIHLKKCLITAYTTKADAQKRASVRRRSPKSPHHLDFSSILFSFQSNFDQVVLFHYYKAFHYFIMCRWRSARNGEWAIVLCCAVVGRLTMAKVEWVRS